MCKKKQFKYCPSEIDECMKNLIKYFPNSCACCCGHGRYPMTIIVRIITNEFVEIVSNKIINRKKRFYKRDKQGYYYIPETLENNK